MLAADAAAAEEGNPQQLDAPDMLTQLDDETVFAARHLSDSIGILQRDAEPLKFGQRQLSATHSGQVQWAKTQAEQLYAMLQRIDDLISKLPDSDYSEEEKVAMLAKYEAQRLTHMAQMENFVEIAESLLGQVRGALQEIASDTLNTTEEQGPSAQ